MGWSSSSASAFPGSAAWWQVTYLPLNNQDGDYRLSNQAGGVWQSGLFPTAAGQSYHLQAYLRGQASLNEPAQWRVQFLNNGEDNGNQLLWSSANLNSDAWQEMSQTFTTPPGVTHFRLELAAPRFGGWLALDGARLAALSDAIPAQAGQDYALSALIGGEAEAAGQESAALVLAYYDGSGAPLGAESVWGAVDYSQSPPALQSGSFTTPPETASFRVGLAASMDNDMADGWLLFDRVALTALSQPIPIAPGQSLDISANVRGVLDGPSGQTSGQLAAHFYDAQGNLLAIDPIWQTTDYNQPTTPQTHSGSAGHAAATQMRVGLMTVLDEGWLAFDAIRLTSLSAPIAAASYQSHLLSTQVSGQLNAAHSGRLFVKYSNGNIENIWQNEEPFIGSQMVFNGFATNGVNNVTSFQVGTEVILDNGNLAFDDLTLAAYSDHEPVTAQGYYRLTAEVTGELAAGFGQGGRIIAGYINGVGQYVGQEILWQNPTNFSGTMVVQNSFTADADAADMFFILETKLDAGHLAFSNLILERLDSGAVIRRSTYSVAGQAIAVKVSGDPEPANNGIFYTYSDHLGSTSLISYGYNLDGSLHPAAGDPVPGSTARYLPFGGWRTQPTAEITDRGYTGHKHNNSGSNDIGLIYMNARYYSPYINRFVSADSIVPDPANPQSFNRYSYVRNNPMTHT